MSLESRFKEHIAERQDKLADALSSTGFATLVVSSGAPFTYFADDRDATFETVAHFNHWCPLPGPHHVLRLEPGKRPLLIRYAPEDYWYEPASLGTPFWLSELELVEAATVEGVWEALGKPDNAAYIGNETAAAEAAGLSLNPESLVARLDWDRAYKTDYEIQCLDEASERGAKGHRAAKEAFEQGASELEIHYAFVQAQGVTEIELPYTSIVALNEKAAFLHYESKRPGNVARDGQVLLIDAGGASRGYASDITRTHVSRECDSRFVALRDGMEKVQKELCAAVEPGRPFGDLHHQTHVKLAGLLKSCEVLLSDPEESVSRGYTRPFFPHGLGHHLGLQVHDVGGHLADAEGNVAPPPEDHPVPPQHANDRAASRFHDRARGLLHRDAAAAFSGRKRLRSLQLEAHRRARTLRRHSHRGQRRRHRGRPPQSDAPPSSLSMSTERIDELNENAWEIALHETDRARDMAQEALQLSRELDYAKGEALAIRTIGYCQLLSSELEDGVQCSRDAAEKLRALGDKGGEATALNALSVMYARLADFEKSLELGVEAMKLSREAGDRRGEAWAFVEIGNVHSQVGDFPEARKQFENGHEIFVELDYEPGMGRTYNLLGALSERSGRPEDALAYYEKSLELGARTGLGLMVVNSSLSIGRLQQEAGNREEARRFFRRAVESAEGLKLKEKKANVRLYFGRLEIEEGNLAEARAHLEEGLRLVEGSRLRRSEASLHEALSMLCEREGSLLEALDHYKCFHRLRDESFDEEGRVRLKNLEIRLRVEKAEREAEIERLRYVELAGMQAQLVQSEKMALLGRLVAGLSHEINTPIGVINSNASLAGRAIEILKMEGLDVERSDALRRALQSLESAQRATSQAGGRIAELVRSLRGYTRLDEAEIQRVDVSVCIADSLELFETQLPDAIALERKLENLPVISCRPGQLNQAFMTVLVNASEAIEDSGRITVSSFEREGRAVIEIADTGRGIPPDRMETLFDIDFGRKESQMRLRMGLSNARTIVEKHGGEIQVESVVGEGTTFRFYLPLQSRPIPHFGGGIPWAARR